MFIDLNVIDIRGDWYIKNSENENESSSNEGIVLNTNHITTIRYEFLEKMAVIRFAISDRENLLKIYGTVSEIRSLLNRIGVN